MEYFKANNIQNPVIMTRYPIDLNYSTGMKTVMIPNDNPETFKIVQKKYGADFLVMPAPRNFLNNIDKDSLFSLMYTDAYSDLKLYKIK